MNNKALIAALGFKPKEGSTGVHYKQYSKVDNYALEVDFENKSFNYGELITADSKTTQNFSQAENWVVLECVDRLLDKGYKPQNITLEKTWPTGHGTSGRLDILVTDDSGKAYLMIECKTAGVEYTKEYKKMLKDGGQLFTYYQLDKGADFLMLYASELNNGSVIYQNEIVKIEDDYRQTVNVKDFYEIWNKLPKDNGIFDTWSAPYQFISRALTPETLVEIKQEDSGKIFNRFLEILRHNVVSDKPNAFNKIFTLFLCKIFDEKSTRPDEELKFQWLEGVDDDISFQKRLTDLYGKGMSEFLSKKVTDFSDSDFDDEFGNAFDETLRKKLLDEFTRIRLMKNNEFAIKEVFDRDSFEDNGKVVKEVVELLQGFKIRYTKKQQYLSDFFELLLTTGLKQESGQFFTPVPIAQFIIRSLPIDKIINEKLEKGEADNLLPTVIDYAAGSGHFLTESMHVMQDIINSKKNCDYIDSTAKKIRTWQNDHFDWADQYVYGIEKDYRLVKVGKVGCYLHGDGIANVVHSDGLGNFSSTKEYTGRLKHSDASNVQDNRQFDVVISNPPYSVSAFRNNARKYYNEKDFELYNALTDQSSEIECLFIERTKQLLKDSGVAGIILPSTILNNSGVYAKAREMIFHYFEIIGITELGKSTFMATDTETVTLFLRRRKNRFAKDIKNSVNTFVVNLLDITINGIETPVTKYVTQVWEGLTFNDYRTIFLKTPNEVVKSHEIYEEYVNNIDAKDDDALLSEIINREKDKLLYFIIAHPQKVVLVKSGGKKAEKIFLGYEFSKRRGSEGIHPILRGKSIDECTKLYDVEQFDNETKASTYIYDAFNGDSSREIDDSLRDNVCRIDLVDMMNFSRADFDKSVSLSAKKKIKIESQWEQISLREYISSDDFINGFAFRGADFKSTPSSDGDLPVLKIGNIQKTLFRAKFDSAEYHPLKGYENKIANVNDIAIALTGATVGKAGLITETCLVNQRVLVIKGPSLIKQYLSAYLFSDIFYEYSQIIAHGNAQGNLSPDEVKDFKIPLPPKNIKEKIVSEISALEVMQSKAKEKLEEQKGAINKLFEKVATKQTTLGKISSFKNGLNYSRQSNGDVVTIVGVKDFKEHFSPIMDELESVQVDGDLSSDYLLKSNDILVVRSNGSANLVGRFLFIEKLNEQTSFSGFTIRIRSNSEKIDSKFLCHYLRTDTVRDRLTKDSKGSNIKSLNQGLLSSIKVPNISLSEQQKIVKMIEIIEGKITKLEGEINLIPQQKEAVLKKYL